MSLWEFRAAVGGFVKANTSEAEAGLSTNEAAQLAAFIDEPPVWH